MTNKPMLSVELELIERVTSQTLGMSAKKDRAYAAHELRALLNAQHAVCSNGILCQNSKCAECGGNGAYKPSKVTGEDVLRWMDEHAAVQRQGEPVACLTRSRNILTQASIAVDGKDHFSAWSEWAPNSIEYGRAVTDPIRNNPVCYEIELLFKEPPAPVAVVMPFAEKVIRKLQRFEECASDNQGADIGSHWFEVLTRLALLNRVQRSPAIWEITAQGEDVLEASRLSGVK